MAGRSSCLSFDGPDHHLILRKNSSLSRTGHALGSVTDPGGAVLPGASNCDGGSGFGRSLPSRVDSDSRFVAKFIPANYRVTIARDSFAPAWRRRSAVGAGQTRDLQVRLALEPLSSKVVVTAQSLPLDAESSPAPVTILTRTQIDQRVAISLPDLLQIAAGIQPRAAPARKAARLRCFSTAAIRITPRCWWTARRSTGRAA